MKTLICGLLVVVGGTFGCQWKDDCVRDGVDVCAQAHVHVDGTIPAPDATEPDAAVDAAPPSEDAALPDAEPDATPPTPDMEAPDSDVDASLPDATPPECTRNAECMDDDPSTTDRCVDGACQNNPRCGEGEVWRDGECHCDGVTTFLPPGAEECAPIPVTGVCDDVGSYTCVQFGAEGILAIAQCREDRQWHLLPEHVCGLASQGALVCRAEAGMGCLDPTTRQWRGFDPTD
jgi:hypothetical protein